MICWQIFVDFIFVGRVVVVSKGSYHGLTNYKDPIFYEPCGIIGLCSDYSLHNLPA
jgi:hypothetical protein